MNRNDITLKLTAIFRDVFEDENIVLTNSTTPDDIENWDSLSNIMLINEIEEAFKCKFSMKDLLKMKNAGDIIDRIEELI